MRWRHISVAVLATTTLLLGACSAGSLGSSDDDDGGGGGKVSLSFLVDNGPETVKAAEQLAKDFAAKNPNVTIKVETRPQGTEGDNLVKTRLSTNSMNDLFQYNTGSLFQALAPRKNLVPAGDAWAGNLDKNFAITVTNDSKVDGAPWGQFFAGAILYNRDVYGKLGLRIPKSADRAVRGQGLHPAR